MTDFVPFTPDEYAPDAPGTALHFQRWFENPIAIAEGDPTVHAEGVAIRAAAMRGVAAGAEVSQTILGVFSEGFSRTNAGAGNFTSGPSRIQNTPALTALRAGVMTVSAQLRRTVTGTGASGTFNIHVYVNGSSVLTLTATGTGYSTFTGDVTFAAGDVIEFAMTTSGSTAAGGGSLTGGVRQVKCLTDIASFWCL